MNAALPRPEWLGRVPYRDALEAQRARREAILAGSAPEAIWLLEHDPVITTGRRAVDDLPDPNALTAAGVDLVPTERGGLATWHGPGQLVAYLLLDVGGRRGTVHGTVSALESACIAWLAEQGVKAGRREGAPGVWVGRDKVAALGLHFRRGVSMHGLAINLRPDLTGFGWITPCGIRDGGVTSVLALKGASPSPKEAWPSLGDAILAALVAGGLDERPGPR